MANDDSIMDFVENIEPLYNRKNRFYDAMLAEGEALTDLQLERRATVLAGIFAKILREDEYVPRKYTLKEIKEGARELVEGFKEYRDYAIEAAAKKNRAEVAPEPMTPEDVAHAQKYEELATRIGIDNLKALIPASPEAVRKALSTGDSYLNTIPLWKWDQAAEAIHIQGLSLSEKVSALKHVAKWHFA